MGERAVQRGDAAPIRIRGGSRPSVASGDHGLQRVRAKRSALRDCERRRTVEGCQTASDQQRVPARAVLVEEEDRLAGRPTRAWARGLDLEKGDEAVHFGLAGREAGQDAGQAERLVAQRRPEPVVAGGGRVALVEDQVDDREHGRQSGGAIDAARDLERDTGFGERPLGPHDPLRDGRLRDEEGAGDLVRRQAAEEAERERDTRFRGQDRVAGDEDEPQQVVADVVIGIDPDPVERRVAVRRGVVVLGLEGVRDGRVLHVEPLGAPELVDRPVLGRGHEPGARVVRDA